MRKLLSALLFLSMFVFLNANEVVALKEPTSEVKRVNTKSINSKKLILLM